MIDIHNLATELSLRGKLGDNNLFFDVTPMPGDIDVLRVTVENRDELPIFISTSSEQILCVVHLIHEDEIKPDLVSAMQNAMLCANVSMPLSSFAKLDQHYVVFGALATTSSLYELIHEINVLSDNSLEALDAMATFLK